MEKKVPERKVTLKDDDIIYVYDKRINKCIREDCEGVVKYGLVLKTSITEEETLNCFACNKCHMKYTAYPNYVRITHPELLHIYNQAEVTARDQKREEDARKQALRDRRKNNASRRTFSHRPYRRDQEADNHDNAAQGRKPYEGRRHYEDRKPYEGQKRYESREPYGERKTYGEKKSYGNRKYYDEHKSFDSRRNSDNRDSHERQQSYGSKKPYGARKPYSTPRSYANRTQNERTHS